MIATNGKKQITLFLLLGISQIVMGVSDNTLNLDYFRTPEAAAFKKYGEESVNEYTGTVDVSVPLYTIKCKDIEIPIVLKYDATGIKVEQEASWVGLGWNLTVGGCINYVCSGNHDFNGQSIIADSVWMNYFTRIGINSYSIADTDTTSWMESIPYEHSFVPPYLDDLSSSMRNYVRLGYGERDFYSVNILGKSFMFFIDPLTTKIYKIGKAEEDFKVEPSPSLDHGIGKQGNIKYWKLTDSKGYVFTFSEGDKFTDSSGDCYTSSWYLTQIVSPLGAKVELSYLQDRKWSRAHRTETLRIANQLSGDYAQSNNCPTGYSSISQTVLVNSSYLKEIKADNQTVKFNAAECVQNNGLKLISINIISNNATVETINFNYGQFGYSNVGGNYAPTGDSSEYRLKLESVKEVTSDQTLTTSFGYNSTLLPSKRSCAQDYWGYYNGQENKVTGRDYSLIPSPNPYMSSNYTSSLGSYNLPGAYRRSSNKHMQAAVLNKVVYPTGGYTTYEYESNNHTTNDLTQSDKYANSQYDVNVNAGFCLSDSPYGMTDDASKLIQTFTITQNITCDLLYQCRGNDSLKDQTVGIQIKEGSSLIYDITKPFIPSNKKINIQKVTLSPGTYTLSVTPLSDCKGLPYSLNCWLKGYYTESASGYTTTNGSYYTVTCGGLRVKKISNFDNNGTLLNYTTYDYTDNGKSTGVLLERKETIDISLYTYIYNRPDALLGGHVECDEKAEFEVFTLHAGKSKFPTFYESCNPGIVGYSKVTKRKYNQYGENEKVIVTRFINKSPTNINVEHYQNFDNGLVLSQETRDADNNVLAKIENSYSYDRQHFAINMVDQYGIGLGGNLASSYFTEYNRYTVWRYPFILSRVNLTKTVSTEYCNGSKIVSSREYHYNRSNHQVCQIDESTSLSNQIQRTRIWYAADNLDAVNRQMSNAHWLDYVVEKKVSLVNTDHEDVLNTTHTYYGKHNSGNCYLPYTGYSSVGEEDLEKRISYSYDEKKNISSFIADDIETVILWSYNGLFPTAKIEGLSYKQVCDIVGTATISSLLENASPNESTINTLRSQIESIGGLITTYKYHPVFGLVSQTLPDGTSTKYEYDGFGRLKTIRDTRGKVISSYQYHYSE